MVGTLPLTNLHDKPGSGCWPTSLETCRRPTECGDQGTQHALSKQQWTNWGKDRQQPGTVAHHQRTTEWQATYGAAVIFDGWTQRVLVASNGGALRHPTWWLNLQTTSEAWIQIKGIRRRVKAEQASATEKQRLWPRLTAMYPGYKRYQEITDRDIPVVILRSIEEDKSGPND